MLYVTVEFPVSFLRERLRTLLQTPQGEVCAEEEEEGANEEGGERVGWETIGWMDGAGGGGGGGGG